jgi:putative hemolysin
MALINVKDDVLLEILLLVVLILLNAFFAASEIALISVNQNKIRMLADKGNKKAQLIENLLAQPNKFLATIQIGITLAGFLASAFAAENFADDLVGLMKSMGVAGPDPWLRNLAVILVTLILAYVTLVLGELVPKRLALAKAEPISMLAVRPLNTLSVVTAPAVKLLTVSTNFLVRILGVDPREEDSKVTEEEIRMMVNVGGEEGTIHPTEKEMINNIFEFNNKTVEEVMTHRMEVAALPVEAGLKEVVSLINEKKFSRIPVYEDSIDQIVGVLHAKDLIRHLTVEEERDFDLRKIIRSPYFVPASKRTDLLFKELQQNKTHLAVVIDEYGGTDGVVTMEDLIEEIMGNIFDEYDEIINDIDKIDDNTFVIMGSTDLDTIAAYFEVELPTMEYDTLSGFIIGQLGRIPGPSDRPVVEFAGLMFKVEEVEEKRIAKVKVCRV